MRYLAISELEQLNSLLSRIESNDGTRITGRLEAYSCKAAGADKKLWRHVAERFNNGDLNFGSNDEFAEDSSVLSSSPPTHIGSMMEHPTDNGVNVKLFYYLVATMNIIFPDYEFGEVKPEVFVRKDSLAQVMSYVNTTIFNTGINRNIDTFNDFTSRMWDHIDSAITLSECEMYSFKGMDYDELDDPFWERGCIWSFNYFFWNKKLKRILLFTCRAVSNFADDPESLHDDRLSSRSSTPMVHFV